MRFGIPPAYAASPPRNPPRHQNTSAAQDEPAIVFKAHIMARFLQNQHTGSTVWYHRAKKENKTIGFLPDSAGATWRGG